MTASVSPRRRREILDALRRGTVPSNGLDQLAVGLGRFETELDAELSVVAGGGGAMFKAVRGDYGSGKTFFARWLADRAMKRGFAVAEVQINEIDTPLHKLETVYRGAASNRCAPRRSRRPRYGRSSTHGCSPSRTTPRNRA